MYNVFCCAFFESLPLFILTSLKTNQKASAEFLADLTTALLAKTNNSH